MLIVYWPIRITFRIRKQTSKPQTNYRCCLRFSYLLPYWFTSHKTITIHKYFWCLRFCEFHSKIHKTTIIMRLEKVAFLSKLHCGKDPSMVWLKVQCTCIKDIHMYKITCRTHMPYVLPRILCVSA